MASQRTGIFGGRHYYTGYQKKKVETHEELLASGSPSCNQNQYANANQKANGTNKIHNRDVLLAKIREWAGNNPFKPIDWRNTSDIQTETFAMMRHFGMESVASAGIDIHTTMLLDVPTTGIYWSKQSSVPLLLDEEYFSNKKNKSKRLFLKSCKELITGEKECDDENGNGKQSKMANNPNGTSNGQQCADICEDTNEEDTKLLYSTEKLKTKLKISDFLIDYGTT